MKKKLIIVGAGGAGREVAQIALDRQYTNTVDWELEGFIDDNIHALDNTNCQIPLLGSINEWQPKKDEVFICSVGSPALREKLTLILEQRGAQFTNVIHPTAIISQSAKYELGLVVYPLTVISTNTQIGKHVLINLHNAIGHDACIGDYSVLSSFCDITGHVKIGSKVFLGSHVTIAPNLKIGNGANVGIGSVVVSSVKEYKNVFGNPARIFKI